MPMKNGGKHPGGRPTEPRSQRSRQAQERAELEALQAEARDRLIAKARVALTPELVLPDHRGDQGGQLPDRCRQVPRRHGGHLPQVDRRGPQGVGGGGVRQQGGSARAARRAVSPGRAGRRRVGGRHRQADARADRGRQLLGRPHDAAAAPPPGTVGRAWPRRLRRGDELGAEAAPVGGRGCPQSRRRSRMRSMSASSGSGSCSGCVR
jgi:hypothetical protein